MMKKFACLSAGLLLVTAGWAVGQGAGQGQTGQGQAGQGQAGRGQQGQAGQGQAGQAGRGQAGQGQAGQGQAGAQGQAGVGAQVGQGQYQTGKIVRVDRDKGVIVIRGQGANAREQEFRIGEATKFYGMDNREVQGGIGGQQWREGAEVRYQLGTGNQNQNLRELRLGGQQGRDGAGSSGGGNRPGQTGTNPGGANPGGAGGANPGGAGNTNPGNINRPNQQNSTNRPTDTSAPGRP